MIAAVLAVFGVLALMLALIYLLDSDKHFILQLLLIVFVMVGSFLVLPKMVIDDYSVCEILVDNTTADVVNTTSSGVIEETITYYEYGLYCFDRGETTGSTFYNVTTTMFYLFLGYFFVYLAVWSFFKMKDSAGGGRR